MQTREGAAGTICLVLSGWVNPLVFFYLMCSIWRSLVVLRRVFAVGIVLCYIATWIFFAQAPMVPWVGHYFWALGGFLILAGELAARRAGRRVSGSAERFVLSRPGGD